MAGGAMLEGEESVPPVPARIPPILARPGTAAVHKAVDAAKVPAQLP
jgi:hypothetical protein